MKGPLSKTLVVITGSESSIAAAKYALAAAKAYGSSVVAAYVVDTATIRQLALSRIFVPDESKEYEDSLEESGRRLLAYVRELGASVGVEVSTLLRKGAVAAEIVACAEELGVDCILIGQGGHGTQQVRDSHFDTYIDIARNAPCSVVIAKARQAEALFRALGA